MPIIKSDFGTTKDGQAVDLYKLSNSKGSYIEIITYGATLLSICIADKFGKFANIADRLEQMADYEEHIYYLGAIVGRVANRIGGASFDLNGKTYPLAATNGKDTLHGGIHGFNSKVWNAKIQDDSLTLSLHSPDGEEGFPGNLDVHVTYSWTDNQELSISYEATTDADTFINLTNHTYFNLAGQGDILHHSLRLFADYYTPTTEASIPTGVIAPVKGTPLDFTLPHLVGERIDEPYDQLTWAGGYDQNFVLSQPLNSDGLRIAAELYDAVSGRLMTVYTTEPGIQFYAGNYLDGKFSYEGKPLYRRNFLCLETQHFPNAMNISAFPSMLLRPGDTYRQKTIYQFSIL